MLTLGLIPLRKDSSGDVLRAFYLTRDHLKIMRNGIEDLDPEARQRDLEPRDHDMHLLLEKWSASIHRQAGERVARVEVSCDYEGPISRQCMEFAALDRVLYNLMNNAAAFTTDGCAYLYIRDLGANVRFVVANEIAPEQRDRLNAQFPNELGRLFDGGFTTGGEGRGLSICGELVSHAYGLSDGREAVERGHVGARILKDSFVSWLHWPSGAVPQPL